MKMIQVKYHEEGLSPIEKIEKGDWIDLRAAEDVFIPHMQMKLVSLGVSIQLPSGYEAHLAPRSSTFKKWGVIQTNSVGVIDESYCGEEDIWKIPLFCLMPTGENENGEKGTFIHKNDRICQFRILPKQEEVSFVSVEHMNRDSRGGFGSTGHQ